MSATPAVSVPPPLPTPHRSTPPSEQSVKQLIALAQRDLSLLVSKEVELAKAELTSAAKKAAVGGAGLAVAGVLAFFGTFAGVMAFGFGLAKAGLATWAAFLVAFGALLLLAGLAGLVGLKMLKRAKPPQRTISTVKADVAWAKHPTQGLSSAGHPSASS